MPAVACLADLDQDHPSVGNIGVEVFAAGVVVVVVVVVAAAVVAVEVAAVDVAVAAVDPHHYVIGAEIVVVAVGPEEVDSGCQENVVVVESVAAARDHLLLVRVVVLAQDQVVLTVVEHRVTEQVTSLYPVAVGPCLVVIHWPPQIQVHLLRHQDHHMDVGDSQMTMILAGDIPHLVVPQGPTVQAALEAYPFRLYIIRMVPPYL
jgi:hypothetical protein